MKKIHILKKNFLLLTAMLIISASCLLTGCNSNNQPETKSAFQFLDLGDGTCMIGGIDRTVSNDTEIVIPATSDKGAPVSCIGSKAFENDTSITSVVIPDGVDSISYDAFAGCTALKTVTLPSSLKTISESAFNGCIALDNLVLPSELFEIGAKAFYGCTSLTSLVIPQNVAYIEENAFTNCSGLTSISVTEGNERYYSVDNCLIAKDGIYSSLILGCKTSVIPSDGSVTDIGSYAFTGSSITTISIPSSVTYIGSGAFSGCASLASVTIPDTVTSIGYAAFYGCEKLERIDIPGAIESIGNMAFADCYELTDVYFDNTKSKWEYISDYPFENVTCTVHCSDGNIQVEP